MYKKIYNSIFLNVASAFSRCIIAFIKKSKSTKSPQLIVYPQIINFKKSKSTKSPQLIV